VYTFDSIRIGDFFVGKDYWWEYSTLETIEESLNDLNEKIQNHIFPFFNKINSNEKLLDYLKSSNTYFTRFDHYPEQFNEPLGHLELRTGNVESGNELLNLSLRREDVKSKLEENMEFTCGNWKLDLTKYKTSI